MQRGLLWDRPVTVTTQFPVLYLDLTVHVTP